MRGWRRSTPTCGVLWGVLWAWACPSLGQSAQISQRIAPDPRGLALGDAFTAMATGPFAAYWNPGGLAQETGLALCPVAYRQLFPSFNDDIVLYGAGVAVNLEPLALGLVFSRLDYGELPPVFRDPVPSPYEWNLHVAMGTDLVRHVLHGPEHLYWGIGAAFKTARADLGPSLTRTRQSLDASGWDIDLGTLFAARFPTPAAPAADAAPSYGVRLGVGARNLLQRQMQAESGDDVPFEQSLRVGFAVDLATARVPPFASGASLLLAIEAVEFVGDSSDEPAQQLIGLEAALVDLVAVRLGYAGDDHRDDHTTYGFGFGGPSTWVRFDWASVIGAERLEHFSLTALIRY